MNKFTSFVLTALFALALVAGCGGKRDTQLNTQVLEKSFANADPAVKPFADRAIAGAKQADYGAVVVELSKIANSEKLTAEQQKALKEVLAKAQKIVAASPPPNVVNLPMAMPK